MVDKRQIAAAVQMVRSPAKQDHVSRTLLIPAESASQPTLAFGAFYFVELAAT